MKRWAGENAPAVGRVDHEMFVDYWRSESGQRARKRDWEATWRNWMRKAQQDHARRSVNSRATGGGRQQSTGKQRIDDIAAALEELNAADPPPSPRPPLFAIEGGQAS